MRGFADWQHHRYREESSFSTNEIGRKEFFTIVGFFSALPKGERHEDNHYRGNDLLFFLFSASLCFAQDYQSITAVKFKDGSIVRGKIIEMNPTTIRILKPDGNIETRSYQDVASFIQGPYPGERPPSGPPVPPPPSAPPPPLPQQYPSPPYPPPQYLPPPRPYATYYRAPANYFIFKAGVYSPESDELRHLDSGFNGEIAFGHYFHPNFALELGAGYFEAESTHRRHDYRYYSDSREEDRIWVVPITLSLKPALQFPPFELYALAAADCTLSMLKRLEIQGKRVHSPFRTTVVYLEPIWVGD